MPIIVVDKDKTVAALVARLLKARTSKAATARAVRAIRKANPGLDLDRLRRGTVVVVPRLAEIRTDVGDVIEDALADVLDRITHSLDQLAEDAGTALEADRAERERTEGVFHAEAVQNAAEYDTVLRDTLETLRVSLSDDEEGATRCTDMLMQGIEQWRDELDDLGKLV
ncbi:hypothetical protein [Streptomyces zaomyceticus]|jgi:hypothetical protein|uniref:hypothetical protein n=1 Tax=Streptomyces zaomyceticus TaxID=68286 RepID=UPI002E1FC510